MSDVEGRQPPDLPVPGASATGDMAEAVDGHRADPLPPAADEAAPAPVPVDRPPRADGLWRVRLRELVSVGAGGFLGAITRYVVESWVVERWSGGIPWETLFVNLTGSFVLGFYLTLVTERFAGRPATRLFVATGFLGAYTTFSAFSHEVFELLAAGAIGQALAYVAVSLIVGLAAAIAGALTAHAL